MDVTKVIAPKSDQVNADSLISGPMTIKITDVKVDPTAAQQPIWVYFEGDDGKPWKPCKTSARCLASIYGPNAAQWVGMHVTIYCDPTVTFGAAVVGGIRISHMEGIDKPVQLNLTKTRGKKGMVTIQPLILDTPEKPAIDPDAIKQDARDAAKGGKDSFTAWWKANPDGRDVAKSIMDELKALAEEADKPDDEIDEDEVPM